MYACVIAYDCAQIVFAKDLSNDEYITVEVHNYCNNFPRNWTANLSNKKENKFYNKTAKQNTSLMIFTAFKNLCCAFYRRKKLRSSCI